MPQDMATITNVRHQMVFYLSLCQKKKKGMMNEFSAPAMEIVTSPSSKVKITSPKNDKPEFIVRTNYPDSDNPLDVLVSKMVRE